MRPAKNAPTAQPSSIEATLKPVPTESESKACCSPSTVPLMTPLSKPNRKPPMVATQLIRMMNLVFSPLSACMSLEASLFMGVYLAYVGYEYQSVASVRSPRDADQRSRYWLSRFS